MVCLMNSANDCLRIAFLTSEPAHDRRSFSGCLYSMGKALERQCGEVIYLEHVASWERRILGRITREAAKHHFKWRLAYKRLLFVAKKDAKIAAQRLAGQHFDAIVAPDCVPEIAFLQTDIPVILPLDMTFRLQHDYYPEYSNLPGFSVRQAEILEQAAFQNASHLLFSTSWVARSAIEDYGIDAHKVHVAGFGANLDYIPPAEQILMKKPSERCRLLFMGIGWERKGGDIAYETLLKLHEMGIEAELVICGSTPPRHCPHTYESYSVFEQKRRATGARD